jgi:hypothetical protein
MKINNYGDLLEFIKRDDITGKQAAEVVQKALNVICIFEMTKEEFIKATDYYIKNFCQNDNQERPIFFESKKFGF